MSDPTAQTWNQQVTQNQAHKNVCTKGGADMKPVKKLSLFHHDVEAQEGAGGTLLQKKLPGFLSGSRKAVVQKPNCPSDSLGPEGFPVVVPRERQAGIV